MKFPGRSCSILPVLSSVSMPASPCYHAGDSSIEKIHRQNGCLTANGVCLNQETILQSFLTAKRPAASLRARCPSMSMKGMIFKGPFKWSTLRRGASGEFWLVDTWRPNLVERVNAIKRPKALLITLSAALYHGPPSEALGQRDMDAEKG